MALNYTDDQLASISIERLDMDQAIVQLQTDLLKAQQQRAAVLLKDQENEVSSNHYAQTVIAKYHEEIKYLNDTLYTDYDVANIDASGPRQPPHYPDTGPPYWLKKIPKKIDSNSGLPSSSYGGTLESGVIAIAEASIDLIKNGYSDGAVDDTLFSAYSGGGQIEVTSGGFSIGNIIVVDNSNVSFIATVDNITPQSAGGTCSNPIYTDQATCELNGETWTPGPPVGAELLDITILAGPASTPLPIGSRVRNFHPGFSNAEREGSSTPYAPEVLTYWAGLLDQDMIDVNDLLGSILVAVQGNDSKKEETELLTAETNITDAQTAISDWQGFPATGVGVGRYGDTGLLTIENMFAARSAQRAPRITEITTALGTLSQDAEGNFTGSGAYLDLFTWIDLRLNLAGGTLTGWYNFGNIEDVFNQQIRTTQDKRDEYDVLFRIEELSEDADGSATIKVTDVSGFANSDTVKVIANGQAVITATILSIGIGQITLSTTISTDYSLENRARILKEK